MAKNVTHKLIESHLESGRMIPGKDIGLKIDQTLTQDATGTLVMLEFEAIGIPRVRTELSAQYVDHNLLQEDFKNADDHIFLRSACKKYGIWYSRPGNGVSHPVHMERLGEPGKTLLGSDSHTCAAGSLGMMAIGAGGLEVAMAMVGEPFYLKMPKVLGVKLVGKLPDWVSAKDIILEMLRRYNVAGGLGRVIEYYGPGLESLSAMDRHVIANMGAELGATTSVFPSDKMVLSFLKSQGRESAFQPILADQNADYDEYDEINLSDLEPLIALPGSPGNVVSVHEVEGKEIYQSYIGSSANPGLRDFAIAAVIVEGQQICDHVSFDVNPTSRQILENMISLGILAKLVHAGARIHQAGCGGCIGMGQAPASGRISLRTVPRNFPGRSGTKEDQIYLCSPETAAASALTGVITDPRSLSIQFPRFNEPKPIYPDATLFISPSPANEKSCLEKGPNIKPLPQLEPLPDKLKGPVLLKVKDNISTDEIMPAGAKVLPFRSNIPEISRFVFSQIDPTYYDRALDYHKKDSFILGGYNYGQGSSREHAALAPRYLGVQVVIAKSFARIHLQNLSNFGILPLVLVNPDDWKIISQEDILSISDVRNAIRKGNNIEVMNLTTDMTYETKHHMTPYQVDSVLAGGLINLVKQKGLNCENYNVHV